MAVHTVIPRAVYTDQTVVTTPETAPKGVQTVQFVCTNVGTVSADANMDMQVDESFDAGANWRLLTKATGMQFNFSDGRPGGSIVQPSLLVSLGEGANAPGRMFRGTLIVRGSAQFAVGAEVL